MNIEAENRLLADLARVPICTVKVREVGSVSVVYLWHGQTRIGVYCTIPGAVRAAKLWADGEELPEPVIEMPCGTHIAASDFYGWYAQQPTSVNCEPRRSVRVGEANPKAGEA